MFLLRNLLVQIWGVTDIMIGRERERERERERDSDLK
jgi:hypothetical protein